MTEPTLKEINEMISEDIYTIEGSLEFISEMGLDEDKKMSQELNDKLCKLKAIQKLLIPL